jgi:hypothetical protein
MEIGNKLGFLVSGFRLNHPESTLLVSELVEKFEVVKCWSFETEYKVITFYINSH